MIGLLGPNGAGKTTTFYMIVGLVASDGGDEKPRRRKLTHLPIHSRAHMGVSYLPQEASVFRKLSVSENIQAVLELQTLSKDDIQRTLEGLLDDRTSRTSATTTPPRCPVASDARSRSPARWRRDPASSCSTSRLPAWTRSRCWKSRKSSASSRSATSASPSPTTMRVKRWVSATAPTSSTRALLAAGRPDEIIYNEAVRKYIWARISACDRAR